MSTAAVACDLRVPVLSRVGKALADLYGLAAEIDLPSLGEGAA